MNKNVSVFLLLALSTTAAIASIEYAYRAEHGTTLIAVNSGTAVYSKPFCQFGMQFLVTTQYQQNSGGSSAGVAVTQVMVGNANTNNPPQPMACKEDVK